VAVRPNPVGEKEELGTTKDFVMVGRASAVRMHRRIVKDGGVIMLLAE